MHRVQIIAVENRNNLARKRLDERDRLRALQHGREAGARIAEVQLPGYHNLDATGMRQPLGIGHDGEDVARRIAM
jgi:hypothetical protein